MEREPFDGRPVERGAQRASLEAVGDLDAAARTKGRDRYLLRVNVPRTPELALDWGMAETLA